MKMLIVIFVACSVASFVYYFASVFEAESVKARLGLAKRYRIPNALLFNIASPAIWLMAEPISRIKLEKVRCYLSRRFVLAGIEEIMTVDQFFAFQLLLAAVFGFIGAIVPFLDDHLLVFVTMSALGFLFPLQWLSGLIKKRRLETIRAMPGVVDLLTLSVEAGLDFMAALQRVVEGSKENPFTMELKRMLDDMKIGASRAEALRHLSERCQIPAISSFTALLIQADRLGASVGPVLRAQSDKLRSDRFQRAERAGAAAAQKILFPLVFCIIPAVFIVIFGPMIVQFVTGGFKFY